ncbi:O-antigen ligase family protein [Ornithinimicrobium sp. LYQ92]|uniref:O-antigen ligase family protein n=1 Tax=Serinicoccus sp. LYQ92 TaxID=3378798 RepID=UPI003853A3FE
MHTQPVYVWLFLLGVASNVLSGHSHRLFLPISPDRVLIPLAIVLLLRDPTRPRLRPGLVHALMVAFVLWTVVSMIWHGNLLESVHLYALLDRTVLPFLMFVLAPLIFTDVARRDLLLKMLTVLGLYLAVTAVLEIVAPQLVFPRYIMDEEVGLHFGRARGPFAGAEAMAMALAVTAGAAGLLATRRLRRWTSLGALVMLLSLFGVVLTTTRSVWVGLAVALVVLLVLVPTLRSWIPAMAGAGMLGLGAVALLMPSLVEDITERSASAGPIYDRLSSNAAALRLLGEMPLTGIGWRRFYPDGAEWARQSDSFPMNNATIEVHNVILSRGAELGIPAMLVFVAIIVLGPVRWALARLPVDAAPDLRGWSVLSAVIVTVWLVAGSFGPMSNPFPNYAVWLIAGIPAWRYAVPHLPCASSGEVR